MIAQDFPEQDIYDKVTNCRNNGRNQQTFGIHDPDKDTIEKLIKAGIQAPSAMNVQPWAFGVIQDKALMQKISDDTKAYLLASISAKPYLEGYRQLFSNPEFNIFYKAPVLLAVFAKPEGPNASCDCTLAAQNIMLAAHSLGLGSCWIGFAQDFMDRPEIKARYKVPEQCRFVSALSLGYAKGHLPEAQRKEPVIFNG